MCCNKKIDFQCEEQGIGCQQCNIDQSFSCGKAGARFGGDTGKIQFVATHGDTHSVCFNLVGLDTAHESLEGEFAAVWDVAATNKKIVLVPVSMRVPAPCARRLRSLARLWDQMSLFDPCMRWRNSNEWTVTS